MSRTLTLTIVAAAAVALSGCAQMAPPTSGHAAHHAAGTASAPAADQMARMDLHMQAMREMHEKMAAATSPEQRQALMAEHMKLMQQGMAMMGGMGGGMGGGMMARSSGASTDTAAHHQMMEKRMQMMQSMMQMMMDRMPAPAPAR